MSSNSFGRLFKFTTFGESHGKAIGVVIDGCPAGVALSLEMINAQLARRAPGQSALTTPRKEKDEAQILSGIFEGKTTGAPISIVIFNKDADSSKYEPIKDLMRPGHANYTYIKKYGCFDYRGGGRSSARETAARVAAGAVASACLAHYKIGILAYMQMIGGIHANVTHDNLAQLRTARDAEAAACPDAKAAHAMGEAILAAKEEGDSLGGVIELVIENCPVGLGDPVYEKLEANLAKAMMSLPATKGFEIGEGFAAAAMKGSEHNDAFTADGDRDLATNHAGGTLGGISTGEPIVARVAFKPTSSIMKKQQTIDKDGNAATFELPKGSRHDPCVAIRAVPIVEAMAACVILDALLAQRCTQL